MFNSKRKCLGIPIGILKPSWKYADDSHYFFYLFFHFLFYGLTLISFINYFVFFRGEISEFYYSFDKYFPVISLVFSVCYLLNQKLKKKSINYECVLNDKLSSNTGTKKNFYIALFLFIVLFLAIFLPHVIPIFVIERYSSFNNLLLLPVLSLIAILIQSGATIIYYASGMMILKSVFK